MKISFNPDEGLIVIPVQLFGPKGDLIVHFALDTGATKSLINWDIVALLGYDPAIAEERTKIVTASGIEFAPTINIAKIFSCNLILENFSLICHTLPLNANIDGLLGIDFFRNTVIQIDFIKGEISVH